MQIGVEARNMDGSRSTHGDDTIGKGRVRKVKEEECVVMVGSRSLA